jgi:hypothetical protein
MVKINGISSKKPVIGRTFEEGTLNVASNKSIPGQDEPSQVALGHEASALQHYWFCLVFKGKQNCKRKGNYNQRLYCARLFVESAFRILADKLRLYYKPLEINAEIGSNPTLCGLCQEHGTQRVYLTSSL